jgi:hypothetical protein
LAEIGRRPLADRAFDRRCGRGRPRSALRAVGASGLTHRNDGVSWFKRMGRPIKRSAKSNCLNAPRCPGRALTRRDFLWYLAGGTAVGAAARSASLAATAPAGEKAARRALTSIGLCKRYEYREVRRALARMLDELGDVRRLVRRRHVTVKTRPKRTSAACRSG